MLDVTTCDMMDVRANDMLDVTACKLKWYCSRESWEGVRYTSHSTKTTMENKCDWQYTKNIMEYWAEDIITKCKCCDICEVTIIATQLTLSTYLVWVLTWCGRWVLTWCGCLPGVGAYLVWVVT